MSPPSGLRPGTSDGTANALSIPSRTSSLHSRIVQPLPSSLKMTPVQPTRTLCYAYAVFGTIELEIYSLISRFAERAEQLGKDSPRYQWRKGNSRQRSNQPILRS